MSETVSVLDLCNDFRMSCKLQYVEQDSFMQLFSAVCSMLLILLRRGSDVQFQYLAFADRALYLAKTASKVPKHCFVVKLRF